MHTATGLFDGVHNPIGCIHSQVVPQKTKVHFKGTPFLLFYVQWPVLLRRRIHIHYIRSKHHKQLSTPVPFQFDCGYQPSSRYSSTALCPANLCHEVQRWLVKQSGAFIKSHSIMLTWNKLLGIINTASSDLSIANEILESVYIV